jgi:hemoglobin-like flavoprotein
MSLNQTQIDTLRESWAIAEPRSAALITRFYEILFERAPEKAAMFAGTDMDAQGRKLGAAVAFVIAEAGRPGRLLPALYDLGRRHAGYGVEPADYDAVGGALISALSETLGPAFSTRTRDAWATAYESVSCAMIAGGMPRVEQSA